MNDRKTWKDLKAGILKNSQVAKEYELLSPYAAVACEIHKARITSGLSQTELARRIGTTQSTIARIESLDNDSISLRTLFRVAEALGMQVKISFANAKKRGREYQMPKRKEENPTFKARTTEKGQFIDVKKFKRPGSNTIAATAE